MAQKVEPRTERTLASAGPRRHSVRGIGSPHLHARHRRGVRRRCKRDGERGGSRGQDDADLYEPETHDPRLQGSPFDANDPNEATTIAS